MSNTHRSKKSNIYITIMFVFDFLNAAAEFFCGIANRIVKPVCFVHIWGLQEWKQWCKRIKNQSRVFLDKYTKKRWVSKLHSRLSFYNRMPVVEKCFDKNLIYSILYQYSYVLSEYCQPPMFPLLIIISLRAPRQCAYASSDCVQKKIALYRNFFRSLNFREYRNFF